MPAQTATASASQPVFGTQEDDDEDEKEEEEDEEDEEEEEEEVQLPLIGLEEKLNLPFHAHFLNENETRIETVVFDDGSIHHFYPRIVFDHRIRE